MSIVAKRKQLDPIPIESYLRELPQRVFTEAELTTLFKDLGEQWGLPSDFTPPEFILLLTRKKILNPIELKSGDVEEVRYAIGEPTLFEVALSLRRRGYLSHGTAVFFHGLNQQLPKRAYLNVEQSPKPKVGGSLAQDRIDAAFAKEQRESHTVYLWGENQIILLSGKFTENLEVGEITDRPGHMVPCTKLERTLIDIAVRPRYAGGIVQVMEAFKEAKSRASANVLIATLKKMDFIYPYHQVLGFYLERAGFPEAPVKRLKEIPMQFDFYLDYAMPEKNYDSNWRLFYPKWL